MRRSKQLAVIDRRTMLGGLALLIAGCRIDLDHAAPEAAPPPPPGVDAPGTGLAACEGGVCLDLSVPANANLTAVDGARVITFGGRTIIVVRTGDDTFVALSAVCTHAGCIVGFDDARGIVCPCHGSTFALDGAVTRGPATRPLAMFATTFDAANQLVTIVT